MCTNNTFEFKFESEKKHHNNMMQYTYYIRVIK